MRRVLFMAAAVWAGVVAPTVALDLSTAVVVVPADLSATEKKAATMLVEEIEKRTQIHLAISNKWPAGGVTVIGLGPTSSLAKFAGTYAKELSDDRQQQLAEGYRIRVKSGADSSAVFVIGNDARGVMFGVGHLLRRAHMTLGKIVIPDDCDITTAPRYALRGHQLGYRPKTNSYDGWDVPTWEQYIRDLVVFGCNAIELIPPRSDDAATSPHFPLPPLQMMAEQSRIANEYGLDVWIWYPAMDRDYSDPKTVEFALQEWGEVFRKLPRIDAIFVPGGDPGHTQPKYLLALLEKQTASLQRIHPRAQMWVSPQSFNQQWLGEFLGILRDQQPPWLSGVVYGPQVRTSLARFRTMIPAKYPIRNYPDITHSWRCEYPVPNWDAAFAATLGREPINPRPADEATIFRYGQPHTVGFITYSEGCNDDVNKMVWSSLGWNPETDVVEILRDYGRYLIGDSYAEDFAQGLLALERNWRGPLAANDGVYTTLAHFQAMEKNAPPKLQQNWRFQQALYRAYYDAYTRSRLIYETELEHKAIERLGDASQMASLAAVNEAESILDRAENQRVQGEWRTRVFELAESLFKSIKMQLSVPRYRAIGLERGANLDSIDAPLNSRVWLKQQFAEIRELPDEQARRARIDRLVHWSDPGEGGFYDDLGDATRQPHLVRGKEYAQDPRFLESSMIDFGFRGGRLSWWNNAGTLFETPLQLRYMSLDRSARYLLRVSYASDSPLKRIRLVADDRFEIHPLTEKRFSGAPIELEIPVEATADGELTLSWTREPGLGDNGRGCQVAEVWLVKK